MADTGQSSSAPWFHNAQKFISRAKVSLGVQPARAHPSGIY